MDDGVRLWVGSTLLIDQWKVQVASYEAEITLPAGPQTIRMEYYENLGGAAAQLSWEMLSGSTCQQSVGSGRWKGEYFATMDLSGAPVMTRDDGGGALDFDWGSGSPEASCGVPADRVSVRFSRTASFSAGTHRFTVVSDDGFRLYVDGGLKLEKWFDQGPTTYTVDVPLSSGNHAVRLDYYENGGGATAKLSWKAASTGPVIVDDGDAGFELLETATGKPEWWHPESVGYGNDMVWTQNTYGRKDNYARWKPSLAVAGNYKVEAHIPSNHATTQQARYVIVADGATHTKIVNQNNYYDQWVELGTYRFRADGSDYVELADVTGETSISREVGFDAIRITFTTDTPPPTTGQWAYPVGSADSGAGWRVKLGLGQSWTSSSGIAYNGHLGEDWSRSGATSLGQPVYAASAGEVVTVLQNCGNYVDVVVIKHQVAGIAEPMYSFYGHIEADGYVSAGDRVSRRQQIGVIGDPVTFGPHLHFEVKNETALVNPPFSTCSNTSKGIYISAGYSGKRNDYSGGDFWDPSNDGVGGNHYYHPTRFIQNRLATSTSLQGFAPSVLSRVLAAPSVLAADDGLPRCEDLP